MKKIFTLSLIFLVLISCTKLEDLNKNTKDPLNVTGESLFTGAQANLFQQMVTPSVNYNIWRLIAQQWTETTYTDESRYILTNRTIPDSHWDWLYQYVIKDLDQASKNIKATTYLNDPSPSVKKNKLAIVEILEVYSWSILVETFGNIPYSQALNIENLHPAYDDGMTIYKSLITRLDTTMAGMDPNSGSFDKADNMYRGDGPSWLKFANSLKLRMGMLLADADQAYSRQVVEEAVAATYGFIGSNDDNARLVFLNNQPNTNPIYDNLVASGRHDFVPTSTLIDTMNLLSDPRLPFFFTQIDTSTTAGVPKMAYVGGVYGISNDFTQYSHVADKIQEPTFEGLIFDYAETEFLLAEGAARGFNVGGTAEDHYNKAVKASILYWGGAQSDVDAYLADPRVAWSSAPGDFKRKIGFQQWIAYYNRGFEAWTAWRKFDWPQLVKPPRAVSEIPVR